MLPTRRETMKIKIHDQHYNLLQELRDIQDIITKTQKCLNEVANIADRLLQTEKMYKIKKDNESTKDIVVDI